MDAPILPHEQEVCARCQKYTRYFVCPICGKSLCLFCIAGVIPVRRGQLLVCPSCNKQWKRGEGQIRYRRCSICGEADVIKYYHPQGCASRSGMCYKCPYGVSWPHECKYPCKTADERGGRVFFVCDNCVRKVFSPDGARILRRECPLCGMLLAF